MFIVGVLLCLAQGAISLGPFLILISMIILIFKLASALSRKTIRDLRLEMENEKNTRSHSSVERIQTNIVLVSCVKTKRNEASKAKDLYISTLFRKERSYAEATGLPWYILSAEYGLVDPEQEIEPYGRNLGDESPKYRREWGANVVAHLEHAEGNLSGKVIEVHAAMPYLKAIRSPLLDKGAFISEPLQGLRQGERLSWYNNPFLPVNEKVEDVAFRFSSAVNSLIARKNHPDSEEDIGLQEISLVIEKEEMEFEQDDFSLPEIAPIVSALRDDSQALTPIEFRAIGSRAFATPGLYSWWVDLEGARELTTGLGYLLSPGLIYAGLAGATHWPSGKRSSNTLWLRIMNMHLSPNHDLSTFRRTLGSILASSSGKAEIDEIALTLWMESHLRVIALPYTDADSLGRMEEAVLEELDPPLNIKGRPKTPIRTQLKALRKIVVQGA